MVQAAAALMVLDHVPDEDEIDELAFQHLDEFPADAATAECEIVFTAPDWLSISEQDQMNAHLRDGAECILIVYIRECDEDDEEID